MSIANSMDGKQSSLEHFAPEVHLILLIFIRRRRTFEKELETSDTYAEKLTSSDLRLINLYNSPVSLLYTPFLTVKVKSAFKALGN